MAARPRDNRLIDALDDLEGVKLNEVVWRVCREDRDPTDCYASGGRWDDATFDVLYTSRTRGGALAEMQFHLSEGQPIIPTRVRYHLHEVRIELKNVLDLSSEDRLKELGLDIATFGRLSYAERAAEYPRTQEIAEVAHFHGFDGLLVPSARSDVVNVVVFCDQADPEQFEPVRDHGVVDWRRV